MPTLPSELGRRAAHRTSVAPSRSCCGSNRPNCPCDAPVPRTSTTTSMKPRWTRYGLGPVCPPALLLDEPSTPLPYGVSVSATGNGPLARLPFVVG